MKKVEKKCPVCGEAFSCTQEEGCWCSELFIPSGTLIDLNRKFPDCLCEKCLKKLSPSEIQ